jgi:hypothetical protein
MNLGPGWLSPFDQSPYSLRFELGGDLSNLDDPVRRFTRAYDRARALADRVFQASQRLIAVVMWTPDAADLAGGARQSGLSALASIGFDTSRPIQSWEGLPPWLEGEDPEVVKCFWSAFDLSERRGERDILLWCAVADEMPVKPDAAVVSYLLDPDAAVLLHVYDDRGMDLTGLSACGLADIYREFDPWLLDYDRARMAAAFEGGEG